jgi:hypothetical protein
MMISDGRKRRDCRPKHWKKRVSSLPLIAAPLAALKNFSPIPTPWLFQDICSVTLEDLLKGFQICSRLFQNLSRLFQEFQTLPYLLKGFQICSRLFQEFQTLQGIPHLARGGFENFRAGAEGWELGGDFSRELAAG